MCLGVGLKLQVHSRARQGKVPKLGQWEDERERTKELQPKIPMAFFLLCFGAGSGGKLQRISLTKDLLSLPHLLPRGGSAAASKTPEF